MKLIHTADLHLDMCYAGAGMSPAFGNRRRQSLRDVFADIVRRAGEWPADALLIAGDLVEGDRVSRDTVAFLKASFESIPDVHVFIAPGNHDPFTETSPYATETWPENVTIFSSPKWTAHTIKDGMLTVHGFAFDGPDISTNPFGTLRIDKSKQPGFHVAVGHGSEKGHQPPDKDEYAPFKASDAAVDGLEYLALGHFHTATHVEGPFNTAIWYSGAPEGHGFRETGSRGYLEVELIGGEAHVTQVPSSRTEYLTHSLACDEIASSQEVVEAIRGLASSGTLALVARVTLTGLCLPEIRNELGAIYDACSPEFEYLDLVDKTEPLEDFDEIAREDTSVGAFVRMLRDELADAPDEARRELLERALEVGIAAFRNRSLEIRGLERT